MIACPERALLSHLTWLVLSWSAVSDFITASYNNSSLFNNIIYFTIILQLIIEPKGLPISKVSRHWTLIYSSPSTICLEPPSCPKLFLADNASQALSIHHLHDLTSIRPPSIHTSMQWKLPLALPKWYPVLRKKQQSFVGKPLLPSLQSLSTTPRPQTFRSWRSRWIPCSTSHPTHLPST